MMQQATPNTKPIIALVDQSKIMRQMFEDALAEAGVEVLHLPTIAKARAYLEENRPAVLFLSSKMPEEDGLSFLQVLRRNPLHAKTPVVLISSKDYMQDRTIAKSLNVMEFMVKPMPMQKIRNAVAKCI